MKLAADWNDYSQEIEDAIKNDVHRIFIPPKNPVVNGRFLRGLYFEREDIPHKLQMGYKLIHSGWNDVKFIKASARLSRLNGLTLKEYREKFFDGILLSLKNQFDNLYIDFTESEVFIKNKQSLN